MVDGFPTSFGDGVNIAARLQELAEPGGVVVSASSRSGHTNIWLDCLGQESDENVFP